MDDRNDARNLPMKNCLLFAGSYSHTLVHGADGAVPGQGGGIHVFRMNTETGELTRLGALPDEPNPTYLATDKAGRFLYACNELGTFSGLPTATASAYSIDAASGNLTLLNRRITIGTTACHITLNDADTHVLVANYTDSGVCVIPIETDGSLGNPSCFLRHKGSSIDPARQTFPHAHSIVLDKCNRRAIVPDLGTDEIVIYDVDWEKGFLRTNGSANPRTAPGEGPRHAVFAGSGKFVYVINEMGSSLCVYRYDEESGQMPLSSSHGIAE
jgi:6-phosphogluconolactonase